MKKYFATSIFRLQFLTPTISGILSGKELFLPDKQILSAEKIKALKTFLREIEEELEYLNLEFYSDTLLNFVLDLIKRQLLKKCGEKWKSEQNIF